MGKREGEWLEERKLLQISVLVLGVMVIPTKFERAIEKKKMGMITVSTEFFLWILPRCSVPCWRFTHVNSVDKLLAKHTPRESPPTKPTHPVKPNPYHHLPHGTEYPYPSPTPESTTSHPFPSGFRPKNITHSHPLPNL